MTNSVRTVVHVTYLIIIAVLTGILVFTSVHKGNDSTRTTFPVGTSVQNNNPSVPWYCQSIENMKKFQDENPTLGVYCANVPGN